MGTVTNESRIGITDPNRLYVAWRPMLLNELVLLAASWRREKLCLARRGLVFRACPHYGIILNRPLQVLAGVGR
jgi:hypothetical protein